MCQSFSLQAETRELTEYFRIDQVLNGSPGKKLLRPTEDIPVILGHNGNRCLDTYAWGIFPFWAKDSVNARSEMIHELEAYKKIFAKQRCIVPCDSFYVEIPVHKKKTKHIRINVNDRPYMGLAALYDVWLSPAGTEYRTCTILTTNANEPVSAYHSRMPVILDEDSMDLWLTGRAQDHHRLTGLMRPFRSGPISVNL